MTGERPDRLDFSVFQLQQFITAAQAREAKELDTFWMGAMTDAQLDHELYDGPGGNVFDALSALINQYGVMEAGSLSRAKVLSRLSDDERMRIEAKAYTDFVRITTHSAGRIFTRDLRAAEAVTIPRQGLGSYISPVWYQYKRNGHRDLFRADTDHALAERLVNSGSPVGYQSGEPPVTSQYVYLEKVSKSVTGLLDLLHAPETSEL